jgi:MFS family permease
MAQSLARRITWRQTFIALRHPNFRLWFMGQLVSLVGTWMQATAQAFLIFQLTNSPLYLGYVGFAAGLPTWLFTLYGGVVADRMSRRTLLLITQTAMMVFAFMLAALALFGVVQPWHIIVIAFLNGIANAFDSPTRLAFVLEMVSREDLANAVALNATMFNLAIVIGPATAGLAYALIGPGWCFMINSVSFIAVIIALLLMQLKTPPLPNRVVTSVWAEAKEGLRYVAGHRVILTLIAMVGITSFFGLSLNTLMPAWAVDILHGDATTNGWLQAARGLGALASALAVASLGRITFKGKLVTVSSIIFPIVTLAYAFVHWLPLSLALLIVNGGSYMLLINLANATVQTNTPDELRGRVMSVYSLIFFGSMPLGALLAGALAHPLGEPLTVALCALVGLGFAGFVWWKVPELRAAA